MIVEYSGLTREIRFSPAWDRTEEGGGRHVVDLRFHLRGPGLVVQFVMFTGWDLKDTRELFRRQPLGLPGPMAADLGYHSLKPRYDGQQKMADCEFFQKDCHYDGSGLNAEPVMEALISEGEEAVWKRLEEFYRELKAEEPS